jgi:hypothetical protein
MMLETEPDLEKWLTGSPGKMIESAKIGAALAAAEESKPFSSAVALNPLPVPYQDHSAERRTPTSIIAICSFLSAVGASSRS